ncbi:cyanophycin synthetase [Synechococcus sp. PCC 7335]|uniref:cyanophycin synthetase n=1 Tax=Synechococcus sp. (strain ATCC 29403 / PCC 7335) TaxID=91464 RepID=UPI00017ECB44|nr:cyanophycin synthetase [Synechococcus sp. PCC 7335]EDX84047.1 cyanophycin synthetase [Synechococcus sp. PCC 7335]
MKVLKTQTLRGPNYWSIRYGKLIVVRLDLEDLAERPSDTIDGFYDGLVSALPSLVEHFCSPGVRGGFLSRLQTGTMMGHIVEHVALELQTLAGMRVGFGRTRETSDPGVYQVVFQYENEAAGRYAARAALRLCESIIETGFYPDSEIRKDLEDLKELRAAAALGPSTEALVRAAEARNVPWLELDVRNLLQFGYGVHQKRVQASLTSHSNILSVELACDKEATKRMLGNAGIPVPKGTVVYSLRELEESLDYLGGYPIVVKPLDGNHGRGITLNISSWEQAEAAYDLARQVSDGVIVEHHYQGRDHRILVVDNKMVAVAERVPAHVVGNGIDTIEALVDRENQDPRRGEGHDNLLTQIRLDRTSDQLMESQGYNLDTVLRKGEICYLRATANLSTGGIAIDRTDEIHPETIWIAERAARLLGLDVAGIDVVTTDISKTLAVADGVIVEVNAAPGLRMHVSPSQGLARNVGAPILDMLIPPDQPSRIPIVAITGTNGKTTTTRLTAHIFRQVYSMVGYTTTDGIYIGNHLVEKGDTTGPQSARLILEDPTVEMAVLETARGGLLRSGLAFDQSDVGIVLNVAADHLGIGDIDTIDQLAKLKAVVAESVAGSGYVVLNADDHRVAAMAERVKAAKVAYFSMDSKNPLVRSHLANGGIAAVYEEGYLSIIQQDWLHRIIKAERVPLTMGGRAPFMIANALAASLAGFVQGVKIEQIRAALHSFQPSASQIPGRMNLFDMGNYHALVDYAHNPAGYAAIGSFVKNWPGPAIGVVGAPGDRRDEDLIELGQLSVDIFDQVIIKEDKDRRGRSPGAVAALIEQGILQTDESQRSTDFSYHIELDESEAVNHALDSAPDNCLVVILPESISRAISLISAKGPVSEGFSPANSSGPILKSDSDTSGAEPAEDLDNTSRKELQLFNGATASSIL